MRLWSARKHGRSRRRCVVTLASDREPYPQGLVRLERSLHHVGFEDGLRSWTPGHFPTGCPSHFDAPFAFKPFCLAEARAEGWRSVLWLDASCVVIRSLDPIFEAIEANGYVLFRNGDLRVGAWASDEALTGFGLTRAQALALPEVTAGVLGLHFDHPIAVEFLESWHEAARHEIPFRGISESLDSWDDYEDVKWNLSGRVSADPEVRGHRHDQTVAGILASRLGMTLTSDGLEDYWGLDPGTTPRPNTVILLDREMRVPHTGPQDRTARTDH